MAVTNAGDRQQAEPAVLAFRTSCCDVVSVVFATSRGRARQATMLSANDAGYRVSFTDVRVRRAPEFDRREMLHGTVPVLNAPFDEHLLRRA